MAKRIIVDELGSGYLITVQEAEKFTLPEGESYPASTAFIVVKIFSKIVRKIEQLSGMRDHEYSAGRLNCKGAAKEKIEAKSRAIEAESTQQEVSSVKKKSLKNW